jgi:tetratricopeptide (TPR) repeat protein
MGNRNVDRLETSDLRHQTSDIGLETSDFRLQSHVPRPTSHVSRLTSHVSRLMSHVSRLTSHVSRLTSHVSYLSSLVTRYSLLVTILSCILCLVSFHAFADSSLELTSDIIDSVLKSAKLKEEIHLSGPTLDELVEAHPGLSGLKQISVKTYQMATPLDYIRMQNVVMSYTERLTEKGWQLIMLRTDGGTTALIYGEGEIRENLLIVLISPSELSEMHLAGEIELAALGDLRDVILESMPDFDKSVSSSVFRWSGTPPSQPVGSDVERLEELLKTKADQMPLDVNLEIRYQLAMQYQEDRQYEKALEQYNYIISVPNAPEWVLARSYYGAAQSSIQTGNLSDAGRYYELLLEKFGTEYELSPLAMDFLERIRKSQDRSSRAEMQMETADEIFSKAGDYEEAIKLYKQIADSNPYTSYAASALLKMGIAYGYLNQLEKKVEIFEKAIKDYPSALNYLYLAKSFQENGEYEEAIKYYETVINEYKNASKWHYTDAYIGAGESSEALGLYEQAKDYYKKLLETPGLYESPKIASVEKKLLKIERGDSLPFLGLGFRHTGAFKGAYIVTVFKNGPCSAAGIQPGDVLRSIDSKPTPNPRSVIKIIGGKKIGDTVTLLIQRSGEVMEKIPVTLTKTPEKLER